MAPFTSPKSSVFVMIISEHAPKPKWRDTCDGILHIFAYIGIAAAICGFGDLVRILRGVSKPVVALTRVLY